MGKTIILKGVNYEENRIKQIPIIDYTTLDSDVAAYAAVVTIGDDIKNSLNYLVKNLKATGLYNKVKAFYPILGETLNEACVEFKHPTDNNYNISIYGTVQYQLNKYLTTTTAANGAMIPKSLITDGHETLVMATSGVIRTDKNSNFIHSIPTCMAGLGNNGFWGALLQNWSDGQPLDSYKVFFRVTTSDTAATQSIIGGNFLNQRILSICPYNKNVQLNNIHLELDRAITLPTSASMPVGISLLSFQKDGVPSFAPEICKCYNVMILDETSLEEQFVLNDILNNFKIMY
jgi:hypothetical protein